MAFNSSIEWTESTWNPITGCTKISEGCINCYAERIAKRLAGRYGYPINNPFRVTPHPDRLLQPFKWRGSHMIFVCSMGDLFHDDVPESFILEILTIIKKCPHHIFQILTKREKRLLEISNKIGQWPDNVWIGVTVESKKYENRIDYLRSVNASVKFLSLEPLLNHLGVINLKGINWVIVGGESGPRARPMQLEWAINIRDQCLSKNIPYFFKQWGGFNKKASGRCLEGREWNELPNIYREQSPNRVAGGFNPPAPHKLTESKATVSN